MLNRNLQQYSSSMIFNNLPGAAAPSNLPGALLLVQCLTKSFPIMQTIGLEDYMPLKKTICRVGKNPHTSHTGSECAGTGNGTGSARSKVASVRPRNIFWTGLGPCAALAHDMQRRMQRNITRCKPQTPRTGLLRRLVTALKRRQITVYTLRGQQTTI